MMTVPLVLFNYRKEKKIEQMEISHYSFWQLSELYANLFNSLMRKRLQRRKRRQIHNSFIIIVQIDDMIWYITAMTNIQQSLIKLNKAHWYHSKRLMDFCSITAYDIEENIIIESVNFMISQSPLPFSSRKCVVISCSQVINLNFMDKHGQQLQLKSLNFLVSNDQLCLILQLLKHGISFFLQFIDKIDVWLNTITIVF